MKKKMCKASLIVLAVLLAVAPAFAGSAVVGSVAGSLNASVGGQTLVPNTVIFSGDSLQVRNGAAVVALESGNRMAFGQNTEASFLREQDAVAVVLGRGNVSLYQASNRMGMKVKAGQYEVAPATGYKTLGEVAMLNGIVTVTSKEGALRVAGEGRTVEVAEGKTLTLTTKAMRAPAPQTGGTQKLGGDTDTILDVGALGAGVVAAILAGVAASRASDAKDAANAANSTAAAAVSAANAANSTAAAAATNANLVGCALNTENNQVFGDLFTSPYTPPAPYSCP